MSAEMEWMSNKYVSTAFPKAFVSGGSSHFHRIILLMRLILFNFGLLFKSYFYLYKYTATLYR